MKSKTKEIMGFTFVFIVFVIFGYMFFDSLFTPDYFSDECEKLGWNSVTPAYSNGSKRCMNLTTNPVGHDLNIVKVYSDIYIDIKDKGK